MEHGPKAENGKQMAEKTPKKHTARNWAQNWFKNGIWGHFLFWGHFSLFQAGPFAVLRPVFPIFGFWPLFHSIPGGHAPTYGFPNHRFACGPLFHENDGNHKTDKNNEDNSDNYKSRLAIAGLAEITETTEVMKNTRIHDANHRFPKKTALELPV